MGPHLHILLIDDDTVDVTTFQRAVDRSGVAITLDHARDGVQALAHLRDPAARRPQVIVLDLRMPRMDGLEFLAARAQDRDLATIPCVVFTTSRDTKDRDECYRRGAAGFIPKPAETDAHIDVVRRVYAYWAICETPNTHDR